LPSLVGRFSPGSCLNREKIIYSVFGKKGILFEELLLHVKAVILLVEEQFWAERVLDSHEFILSSFKRRKGN
jgi:hypothetical protein